MTSRVLIALSCALIGASGCTTVSGEATAGGEIGSGLEPTAPPRPPSLDGAQACTIVDEAAVATIGWRDAAPQPTRNNWGSICHYQREDTYVSVLLTDGPNQGLAQLKPHENSTVATRTIGGFPARQEAIGRTCMQIAELVPGRALRVTYSDPGGGPAHRCARADTVIREAISGLPTG